MHHIRALLVSIIAALLLLPLGLLGQDQRGERGRLTLNEVKRRLKQNQWFLEETTKWSKAGQEYELRQALEEYSFVMEVLDRAFSQYRFEGSEFQREEALERVEKAVRKHSEVLAELRVKVPEECRPAVEQAMAVSRKVGDTARGNLQSPRAQRQAGARHQDLGG